MKLKSILKENKFNEVDWQEVIKNIYGAKFIHMHPDKKEVEFEVSLRHFLIEEEEDGSLRIFYVKPIGYVQGDNEKSLAEDIDETIDMYLEKYPH